MELFLQILFLFAPVCVLSSWSQLYPNVPGSASADLDIAFNCTASIYSGSVLRISSTNFEFLSTTTCQLRVLQSGKDVNATAGSCNAHSKYVDIAIETGSPLPFSGNFHISLSSAVDIQPGMQQLNGSTKVTFDDRVELCQSEYFLASTYTPNVTLSSSLSLANEESTVMQFSYADLQLNFSADVSLAEGMTVWLQFSQDYDSFLGNVVVENGLAAVECETSYMKNSTCHVFNRGIYSKVEKTSLAHETNWLAIKDFRIPEVWGPATLIILSENNSTFALCKVTMLTTSLKPLNLRCCYSFSREERAKCTMADKSVCKAFGGNGGDYTSDMNMIDFLFQQEMNTELKVNCEDLFDEVTFVLLGKAPLCFWRSSKKLRLYLGANPEFRSQIAYFRESALKLKGSNVTVPALSVFVSYPPKLIVPQPVISGSTTVSDSVKAVLDCGQTKNTGRRGIICQWSYGKEVTNQTITIAKSELKNPVRLTVTNFWDQTASTSLNLTVKTDDVLSVQLLPSDSVFNRSSTLIFTSVIMGSNSTDLSGTNYTWIVQEGQKPLSQLCSNAQRSCTIPQNSLESGHNYTVTLLLPDTMRGYAVKKFRILPTPVHLIVRRPLEKIYIDNIAVFNASGSFDPDDERGEIECVWVVNENYNDRMKGLWTTLPQKLGDYSVKVSCNPTNDKGRVTSEVFSLKILDKAVPTVITQGVSAVNPGQTAKLTVLVQDCVNCTSNWTVPDELSMRNPYISPTSQPSVLIGPYTLDFGRDYTFTMKLTMKHTGTPDEVFDVSMTFYVNSPPVGGTFTVNPTNGTELLTNFALIARSWMDLEGNYPLTYQYFRVGENNVSQAISAAMLEYSVSTVLGIRDGKSNVTLVCNVSDSLGASFTSSEEVELSRADNSALTVTLKSINSSPSPSSTLMTAVAVKDFISQSSLSTDTAKKYHETLLSAVNNSLASTPLKNPQTFMGVSQVVGYLTSSADLISETAMELSVAALQSAADGVGELERDQATVIIEGISNVTSVGIKYQGSFASHADSNQGERALVAMVAVVDGVCEGLMARSLPDANPIRIVTENFALTLQRFRASEYQTLNVTVESRVVDSELSVNYSSIIATFENATVILDSRVVAYSFTPNQTQTSEMRSVNSYISSLNTTVQDDDNVIVTETTLPIKLTFLYPNVSKAGAVGTRIVAAGSEGEMGTVDPSAKAIDVEYNVSVTFPSADGETSKEQCSGFNDHTEKYSRHNCDTEVYSKLILCKCSSTSAVTVLPIGDKFGISLKGAEETTATMFKWKYTKWSFSLIVVLALALVISIGAALFTDFMTEEKIQKLNKNLVDIHKRVVEKLKRDYPTNQHFKNFVHNLDLEAIPELLSKSRLWKCWCCRNSRLKEFRLHCKALRNYVVSPDMESAFTFNNPPRLLSLAMREMIAKNMDIVDVMESFKRQVEAEINIQAMQEIELIDDVPDILLPEEYLEKCCLTLEERINRSLNEIEFTIMDESQQNLPRTLSRTDAILRVLSLPLAQQINIFHINDLMPVDSWWTTLVEKDLILSLLFYTQKQVSRVTRAILLWDFLLIQLAAIGIFLNDFSVSGNDLATVSAIFDNLNNPSFWRYFGAIFGVSFAWTTVLEIMANTSPEDIITHKKSKILLIVQWISWLLGIGTILLSLVMSFRLAGGYSSDEMLKWMICYAISVFKDVLLGFHIKGIAYIAWRKYRKYLWACCGYLGRCCGYVGRPCCRCVGRCCRYVGTLIRRLR